jgi:serine/threonine-protein kinase
MPRPSGTRVDHYELVEHLADGAQAEVHRAKDVLSGEEVVIKFPHARVLDRPALAARWRREAALTEVLYHPGVQCRVDVGERHHQPYVVLEYASGGSLRGWVSSTGPRLPIGQAVEWGRQLAQALAFLHQLGVVHRDVKPDNVLVTDELTLKLADFGAATHSKGRPGQRWGFPTPVEGTPEYLSPEQIIGHPGDERSDIYGWGVVVYELLTGHVPHTGPNPLAAMAAHLNNAPVPIHNLRSDVPPGLEAVVLTALRRQPGHRYPSALALLDDLDRLDQLNLADYDLSPEPVMPGVIGGSEGPAMLRFALLVAGGFISIVALVIVLSIVLR